MRYVNDQHLRMRVLNSVIKWEGQLFYVKGVQQGCLVGSVYPTGKTINVPYWECDFSPFPLGYLNLDRSCLYLSRWPTREGFKQGITEDNLHSEPLKFHFFEATLQALVNTAYGIYPSLGEIYEKYNTIVYNTPFAVQAFSRYFAVTPYTNTLYYKNDIVGEITQDKKYKLHGIAMCLTELLEETLNVS